MTEPVAVTVFHLHPGKGTGPVHRVNDAGGYGLSWCGQRSQFRHVVRPGTLDEVTCKACLRQTKRDQPLAYKSRR